MIPCDFQGGLWKSAASIWFSWSLCLWQAMYRGALRPMSLHVRSPIQMEMSCVGAPADNPRWAELLSHHIASITPVSEKKLQITEAQTAFGFIQIPCVLDIMGQREATSTGSRFQKMGLYPLGEQLPQNIFMLLHGPGLVSKSCLLC